jgi:hypothetical protein
MSTHDDEYKCRWESDHNFVRAIHRDGDEHLMTWDGKQLGPDWMTPLAGLMRVADENRSMVERAQAGARGQRDNHARARRCEDVSASAGHGGMSLADPSVAAALCVTRRQDRGKDATRPENP